MKIISISEERTAKDSRNYFVAEFRPSLGQRSVKRTFWQQFVRDAKTQVVDTTKKFWERMSPAEAKEAMAQGALIDGRKVTHTVTPYELGEKMVDTFSTVIFPDEKEEVVFANQFHNIVNTETGNILGPIKEKKAVLAPNPSSDVKEGVTK